MAIVQQSAPAVNSNLSTCANARLRPMLQAVMPSGQPGTGPRSQTTLELQQAEKGKRILRPLTDLQWTHARIMFETGGLDVKQRDVAAAFNTSLSSVQKRSAVEKWSKGAQFVADARKHLANVADSAMAKAADVAATQMAAKITKELQPWIEKEKRAHIQRAIKRSKRALKRIDRIADGYQVYDSKRGELVDCTPGPKDEMHFATAEDKWDGIIRRNLGMGDSSIAAGSLSLRILTGDTAIELKQGSADS